MTRRPARAPLGPCHALDTHEEIQRIADLLLRTCTIVTLLRDCCLVPPQTDVQDVARAVAALESDLVPFVDYLQLRLIRASPRA